MRIESITRFKRVCAMVVLSVSTICGVMGQGGAVSFEGSAPLNVGGSQRFQVVFTLKNAKGSDFTTPVFEGLRVLMGPSVSNMSSYSNINGVASSETSEVYTFLVEADGSKSVARVGSATVSVDGKVYKSKALDIQISDNTQASGQRGMQRSNGTQQTNNHTGNSSQQNTAKNTFLRLELSKTSAYKGEGIGAELILYTKVGISAINNITYPSFKGFWAVELDVPKNTGGNRKTIEGTVYEAYPMRRWLLYPQQSGTLEIEASTIEAVAQKIVQSGSQSIYDQFFGGGMSVTNVPISLSTGTRRVNVKPLPAGAPIGEEVAVGNFTLTSTITPEKLEVNKAGNLTVTLSGEGDFPLIETPYFKLPTEFESYNVKTSDKIQNNMQGSRGSRVWEFPFVARSEGEYTIPSIEITYFNPSTKKYTTLKTPEYQMSVGRGSGGGAVGSMLAGVSKEELEILNQDIRFINTQRLQYDGKTLLYSSIFYTILVVMVVLTLIGIAMFRFTASRNADELKVRSRGANKMAMRRLRGAKRELGTKNSEKFYAEVLAGIWGFMSDRFGIEFSELNKDKIRSELELRGMNEETIGGFIGLLEECEMAKYGLGAKDLTSMRDIYNRAVNLLF